jgi:tricorn protease
VAADALENPVVLETRSGGVDDVALADDGDEMALVIDGEILLLHRDQGGRAVACAEGPWLDETISFRPGSADTLLFVTDRFGEDAVCLLVSDQEDESLLRKAKARRIVKLTDGKRPCGMAQWSPDGKRIAYVRGNGDLRVMNADGGDDRSLSDFWNLESFSWAPDSRWLAFSRSDRNYNSDIWIVPAAGGDAVNVTLHPEYDENPVWSPDGRMLAWSTTRHSHDPATRNDDVYMCYLTRADDERTREEWELWQKTRDDEPAKPAEDEEKADDDEQEAAEEPFEVVIDFEDIHLRGRRMTDLPGVETVQAIGPESDLIYFTATIDGDRDLYSIDRFADERENITSGGASPQAIRLDPEGKTFVLIQGGKPGTLKAGGGKVETVDFTARLTVDRPAARQRVLDEAWRVLRDNFYDPDMHGVDWSKLRGKYAGWVALAAHDRDFADVVNWMLGELNASHMGYYPGWESEGEYADDGWLGLEYGPAPRGAGLRIERVVRNGPCDKEACRLLPGDVLLRVDGRPVGGDDNLWAALENRQDLPTALLVERDGKELEFETVPVGWFTIYLLNYLEAERDTRAAVEAASGGRVGYVHIRGMGFGEVERFQQNLFAAADGKEALIIDVRNNGGGWTTDLLLTALTQPEHAFTIGRGGEVGYPQVERQPYYRWAGPIAVICNEGSYSNAEIFSHAIKTIGRGPVVGMETGGNVISTGGFGNRYSGYVRLPFRGWWVWGDAAHPERNGKFQEGVHEMEGCIPDHVVDLTPADRLHGRDPQVDKAVELMLEAADAARRLPERRPIGGWDVWKD